MRISDSTLALRYALLLLLASALPSAVLAQGPPREAPPTFKTEVIETTPLPGVGLPLDAIPAPVQTALAADFTASGALDLSDLLNRRLTNVFVNEIQGNPFQPDVNYRGYTASPLLGTPQGLSVYMDGVRLNQPFGDVVSWDLIPRVAIASTTLIPGSNPLFGLNTLGGALVVQTKDGRSNPGTSVQVDRRRIWTPRRRVRARADRSQNGLDWYLAGNLFHDSGWRDVVPLRRPASRSPRSAGRDARTELHVTGAYADNVLTRQRPAGTAAARDRLRQRLHDARHDEEPRGLRQRHGEAQSRRRRSRCPSTATSATSARARSTATSTKTRSISPSTSRRRNAADGRRLHRLPASARAANTPFPFWRCIAQVLQRDEPGEKCNGLLNRTAPRSRTTACRDS